MTRLRGESLPIDLDGIEMRWASQWNESDDGEVRAWREDVAALIDEVHRLRAVSNRYFEEMVRRTPGSSDPEAGGLDVERLAEALRATGALWSSNDYYEVTTDADEFAAAIAAEYARLTEAKPESPAPEEMT